MLHRDTHSCFGKPERYSKRHIIILSLKYSPLLFVLCVVYMFDLLIQDLCKCR